MKKTQKKKRTPPMECAKAVSLTNRLFTIGAICTAAGIIIGSQMISAVALCLLVLPGAALMCVGYFLQIRWALCPHCGKYLGAPPQMIRKMPEFCEHCKKEL